MRYLLGGATLDLDPDRCNGCRRCTEVCPHAVFALVDRRARIVDRAACMECGACARNCEPGAIQVRSGVGCAVALRNERAGRGACCDSGCSCA